MKKRRRERVGQKDASSDLSEKFIVRGVLVRLDGLINHSSVEGVRVRVRVRE